jgi:hypothetical protein
MLYSLAAGIEHVPIPLSTHVGSPLEYHDQYFRVEVLVLLGFGEVAKPLNNFVRHTPLRHAICPDLIHWEVSNLHGHRDGTAITAQQRQQMATDSFAAR